MMCLRRIIGRCTSEISGPRIGTLWATWKKSQEGANPGSSNGASTGNPSGASGLFTHTKRGLSSSSHGMVPTFSTPSFGPISPSSGTISEEELGNVSLQPVTKDVSCRDLHGPWVIVLPQNMDIPSGELMFELDGSVCYRPGEELGGGIGKYTLQVMDTTPTTITIHLECYTYAQKGSMPPSAPAILHIQGLLQHAVITSHDQKILTLHGHAECVWNGKKETGMVQAAKLDGWTPESQKVKPWVPNYTLQQELSTLLPPLSSTRSDVSLSRAEHRVGKGIIDSVYYVPKWISSQAEEEMLSLIQNTPEVAKSKLVKRVAQEWGCTMCQECNLSFVSDINLPPWCSQICDAMITDNVFSSTVFPNSVRIHEYNIGDGIAPHVDGPIYVPIVAIISLGAPCVFSFYPKREPYENPMEHYDDTFRFDGDIAKDRPLCSVVLESRSLLIFEKDAYWYYPHGISDRATDSLREDQCGPIINRHLLTSVPQDATELPRAYRVGVTVRHLLPRCAHQINRQEYFMKRAMSLMKSTPTHLSEPSLSSRPSGSNARTSVSALPTSSTNSGNKSTKGKSAGVTFPRVRGEHTATTNPLSTSQVRNSDGQHSEGRPLEPPTAPSQPSQTQDRANHFSSSTVSKIDTGKAIPSTAPFPPSNQHTETVPSTGPVQQNTLNAPGDTSTGVKASFPCEAPHVQHVMPMGWGTAAHPGAMHPPIPMYPMYYCAPGLPSPLAYAYPPHVPNMSYPGTAQVSPHTTYIPQPPYTPNGAMPHHHPSPPPTFNNPATNSSSGSSSSSSSNTHVALQQDVSPKSATTAPCTDVLNDMKKKLEVTQKTLDTVVRAQNELQQTMQTLMMTLASAQEQSGSALDTVSRAVVRMDVALNKIIKNNISSS